jgi:hypothetical protein
MSSAGYSSIGLRARIARLRFPGTTRLLSGAKFDFGSGQSTDWGWQKRQKARRAERRAVNFLILGNFENSVLAFR